MGGLAEYVSVPESALAPKPADMSYEEAAALPQAGAIALQGIRGRRDRPSLRYSAAKIVKTTPTTLAASAGGVELSY